MNRAWALSCSLVAAIIISTPVLPVRGQGIPDIGQGEMVAARVCAGCHGTDGIRSGAVVQGIVVPSFRQIANRPGRSQEMLEARVMSPHWPMPGLPLEAREIRDVVAYILSLK